MPIKSSPYHIYERGGYTFRESRNAGKVTVEVSDKNGKFYTIIKDLGSLPATRALNRFVTGDAFKDELK